MTRTPAKLNPDAIAEAICEVRFECEESKSLPELVVGKLAAFRNWEQFAKIRLPISDIPAPIRAQDPNLRNQPSLELRQAQNLRLAKIGPNVLSYHRLAPYPGWDDFKNEIEETIKFLFASFNDFECTRIGFRYVNLFTDKHGVSGVGELNYSVNVAGEPLSGPQNLNYNRSQSEDHIVQVRIASPEFVSGPDLTEVRAVVDLDVFTPGQFETHNADTAVRWIEEAHNFEKEEFFRLFTEEMRKRLVETP